MLGIVTKVLGWIFNIWNSFSNEDKSNIKNIAWRIFEPIFKEIYKAAQKKENA